MFYSSGMFKKGSKEVKLAGYYGNLWKMKSDDYYLSGK